MAGRHPVAGTRPPDPTIRAVPADPAVLVDPAVLAATPVAPADRRLAITRAVPVARADLVARAVRVDPAALVTTPAALAGLVVLVTTPAALAGLVAPVTIPVLPAVSVDRIRTLAARGMATPSAAISAVHRGAMGLAPGEPARRRDPRGTDRYLRPVGAGTTARSITGATRKRPSGIRVSTSGVSGSSGFGYRFRSSPYRAKWRSMLANIAV